MLKLIWETIKLNRLYHQRFNPNTEFPMSFLPEWRIKNQYCGSSTGTYVENSETNDAVNKYIRLVFY